MHKLKEQDSGLYSVVTNVFCQINRWFKEGKSTIISNRLPRNSEQILDIWAAI